jgi:hypothetical protein
MNLQNYKWFHNPRGLHNFGVLQEFILDRYRGPHMGWAKLVVGGNERVAACRELSANECMPIIRIFRENMGSALAPENFYEDYRQYINAGALYFELYNEPNLDGEWPQGSGGPVVDVNWENVDTVVGPMMENWLTWAERIIDMGGYPGFPALTDSADKRHATVYWQDAFLKYLAQEQSARMSAVIANGLWCATHPYLHNHFYQEPPGGPSHIARPYYQESASESGWHFEYPYDPLQQKNDPGRTVFGGTKLTPWGDPNGLIASGQAFQELLKKYFNAGPIPVIGTEGGVWQIPRPGDQPYLIDDRYPPYSHESQAEATVAMFEWIARQGPPWFWGVTLWNESDYFDLQGTVLAVERLINTPVLKKVVPSLDTGGGGVIQPQPTTPAEQQPPVAQPTVIATGPRPVQGEPDYHWLVLAPGLQADWFFQAARRYWQTFRPMVLTEWDLIRFMPTNKSLAVTVLARSDTIEYVTERIQVQWPSILFDPVVYDNLGDMQKELDNRATYQKRFGEAV